MADGLRSVRSVVDDTLNVDSVESYEPLGKPLDGGVFGSPVMFTGEPLDANGLVHLRARYYVPELGVFPSLDPIGNLNRYQYVGANPANAVDPSWMIGERPIGLDCQLQQVDECEFNDCHARYLAHAAISETTSDHGDFISYSAMAALMLASVNYAGGGTNFYSFESIRRWLNTNPNYPDLPETLEGQGQARDEYMSRCQSNPTHDMGTFSMSEINRNALAIARAVNDRLTVDHPQVWCY